MLKKVNILRILAMLMISFSVMFTLTGCGESGAIDSEGMSDDDKDKSDKQLADDQRQCWQNEILKLLYDTMGKVAMGTYKKITEGALSFMMVAFSLWFVLRLLKFVASVKDVSKESPEMWNEVLQKLLICFICGLLASSTDGLLWVLNMVIFPIYNAFLDFGGKILETTSKGDIYGNQVINIFGEEIKAGKSIVCRPEGYSSATLAGFPEAPRNMMECMICAVNERLTLGNALSYKVLRLPGFMATIVGLLILATFTMIKLGFVFYLVDTIFRFTMMVVILPILVMAYAFDQTKKWTSTGFTTILNSAAFVMMIAILIAMALLAVVQIIQDHPETFNPQGANAEDSFKEFNPAIMSLLLIAFLIKNTLSVAQKMVSAIVGGSAEAKFQKKLKAAVMMVGKTVAAWLTAGASRGVEAVQKLQKVKKAIDKVKNSRVGKAASTAARKYKAVKGKADQMRDKLNNLAGRGKGK